MRGVALHELSLVRCERGAERRHDFFDPDEPESQHVEVALHDDRPLGPAHGVLRDVQVVEQLPLVEDRGLGGIEILRLSVAKDAAAEANDPGARVVDREKQPPVKAGGERAVLSSNQQPRLEQHILMHAQSFHRLQERLPLRHVAQAQG